MNDIHRMLKEHKNNQEWLEHELELAEQRFKEAQEKDAACRTCKTDAELGAAVDAYTEAGLALQEFQERSKEV